MDKTLSQEQIDFLNDGVGKSPKYRNSWASWNYNEKTGLIDVDGNFINGGFKMPEGIEFGNISGYFTLNNAEDITSLEGFPKTVGKGFAVEYCQNLQSLEGGPQNVGGRYACRGNDLTSLKGIARTIDENIDCSANRITTLEGISHLAGKDFNFSRNRGIRSTILEKSWNLMKDKGMSWDEAYQMFKEYKEYEFYYFLPDDHYGFPELQFGRDTYTKDEILEIYKGANYGAMEGADEGFYEYGNRDVYCKLFYGDKPSDDEESSISDFLSDDSNGSIEDFYNHINSLGLKVICINSMDEYNLKNLNNFGSDLINSLDDSALIEIYILTPVGMDDSINFIKKEIEKRGIYNTKLEAFRRINKRRNI